MLTNSVDANRNLVSNIDYIKTLLKIKTDRALAEQLGISPATIVSIRREGKIPAIYPFFQGILNRTGFSFEELLNVDLAARAKGMEIDYPDDDLPRYLGLYIVYYFRTQSFKGREILDDEDSLEYGLIGIYRDPDSQKEQCVAVMGLKRDEAESRYNQCLDDKPRGKNKKLKKNYHSILMDFFQKGGIYTGNIQLTHGHIFITCSSGVKDVLSMVIHRPDSSKQRYIGGLGAAVSVSKGRDSCPCVQFIGMSRYILGASESEIANHIKLAYPTISPGDDLVDVIIDQIEMLMRDNGENTIAEHSNKVDDLASQRRKMLIRAYFNTAVSQGLERNLFRVVKVSAEEDNVWYHFCKEYDPNEKGT